MAMDEPPQFPIYRWLQGLLRGGTIQFGAGATSSPRLPSLSKLKRLITSKPLTNSMLANIRRLLEDCQRGALPLLGSLMAVVSNHPRSVALSPSGTAIAKARSAA